MTMLAELRQFISRWMDFLESGKYTANKRLLYEKRIEEYTDLYILLYQKYFKPKE